MTDREVLFEIRDEVKGLAKIMNGNGKPGVVAKLQALEEMKPDIKKAIEQSKFMYKEYENSKSAKANIWQGIIINVAASAVTSGGIVAVVLSFFKG